MLNFLLTMLSGTSAGYVFMKLKVPGGMMIGSIIGVAVLNIKFDAGYMPYTGRLAALIVAGAFVGVGLEKSDLIRLKHIVRPALTLLVGMLILNIISGLLIYLISPLDLVTSLMSAVPGGMSNIPIISEEMGAESAIVALLQFIRMAFGIGVFPSIIAKMSKLKYYSDEKCETEHDVYKRSVDNDRSLFSFILTMIVSVVFGIIGKMTGIPSAALVFPMIGVILLKITVGKAYMPVWMRRFAQLLAGAYIGSNVTMRDIAAMKYLILPAIILLSGYFAACFIIGNILNKKFKMPIDEAMLAATPAGASDMALISADIGIESSDLIVLQIIRMVAAVSVFPQIIRIIVLAVT